MMHIIDIFDKIVDTLRVTGAITSISEASGVSTITSVNSLAVDEVVRMVKTYSAGEIKSVSSHEDDLKSIIEFGSDHKLKTGASITFAGATESSYNTTHSNIKVISTTKIIINTAYVAEPDTSSWTGTGDIDYIIQSSTSAEFTVEGTGITATTWKALAPYFDKGNAVEIANTLSEKDSNDELKYQKYPLIWLMLDAGSDRGNEIGTFNYDDIRLFIVNLTEPHYKVDQRRLYNFDPILLPLYDSLLIAIRRCKEVDQRQNRYGVPHKMWERYFWGSPLGKVSTKNIFNDFLDAVDIQKLKINTQNTNCKI